MTFDVLGTMRAIRNDKELTSTQALLLMCAVLRTDNKTRHVRMSLEGLAIDAKLSRKTASRAFDEDQPQVLKYFSKVVRSKRQVDLWFTDVSEWDTESQSVGLSVQREGHSVPPSTSSSTSIYQEASANATASTLQEEEHKEEEVTESVDTSSLPEEDNGLLNKYLANKADRDAWRAQLDADLNVPLTPDEEDRARLSKGARDYYWRCRNRKRMTHTEAMASAHEYEMEDAW